MSINDVVNGTHTKVSHIKAETDDHGLGVTVTVIRANRQVHITGDPRVDDVPADIRAALQAWLNEAK